VYWVKPKQGLDSVSRILITENLSFFHSCKRYLKDHVDLYGVEYDMLIYGSGRHIENNLSFIYEILENDNYSLDYVGDIDPTGLDIYINLKERYPSLNIKLALNIYSKMVEKANALNIVKQGQRLTDEKLDVLLSLDEVKSEPWLVSVIEKVVQERVRVPQEAISYEYLVGGNIDDQSGNNGRISRA